MKSTPCRSQISRTRAKYSGGGTDAPVDDPPTGSAMNAATLSGPVRAIASSSASPLHAGQSGGSPRQAHRYEYGAGIEQYSGIHSWKIVL